MAKQKINLKNIAIIFASILIIILIFTFIDYIVHSLSEEYAVPSYYFKNKIIFGTLWGGVAYFFIRKIKQLYKSLIFSVIVAILLQFGYLIKGYPLSFVLEFLVIHFLILLFVSYIVFKLMKLVSPK